MRTRAICQIAATAALVVFTIGGAVLADPGHGPAARRLEPSPAQVNGVDGAIRGSRFAQSRGLVLARRNVTRIFDDADGPRIRREDGQEFSLTPLPVALKQQLEENAARIDDGRQPDPGSTGAGSGLSMVIPKPPGLEVLRSLFADHREFYGPIRNQGGRGTCVSFSIAAAMEGLYRRRDANRYQNLDLSEQWSNHIQKMVSLNGAGAVTVDWRENQLGSWGGSGVHYLLRVLQRYGLPEEGVMAYNGDADYGPKPAVDPEFVFQRTTDDFNLDPNVLPLTGLARAPYRPTGFVNLSAAQSQDTGLIERLIREGTDVIIDMSVVTPEDRTVDGAWTPGADAKPRAGHSMLFIGYNNPKRYFICRNSWGYDDTDGGYTRVSYDYVAKFAYAGAYVTSVSEPSTETPNGRLYLGRWKMNHDGFRGTLDLYRMPALYTKAELNGQTDYRIGTYFDSQGRAFRVNGYLQGHRLVFYINFNRGAYSAPGSLWTVGMPYGKLEGTVFVARLFSRDDQTMAGLEYQGGALYGFHATKLDTPSHTAAPASANPRDAFLGRWTMSHDGWKGELRLSAAGQGWYQDDGGAWRTTGAGNAIEGWYRDADGNWRSVVGAVFGSQMKFYIWFGWWQPFDGYVYSWDKGLMSGVCYWNGMDFGFTAARQG